MKHFFLVLLLNCCILADIARYDGYKVYEVIVQNDEQAQFLKAFENHAQVDFWSDIRKAGGSTTIMVNPEFLHIFTSILEENHIPFEVIIDNVESICAKEREIQVRALQTIQNGRISFTSYNTYEKIQAYVNQIASNYSNIVTVENLGNTSEGRVITGLRISTGGSEKPLILVDGGIHAREWIAPAQALYIIQQLVENSTNINMIKNVDWYIVPVLNPDGYVYSHTNVRMWRKNRKPGKKCYGVDLNRNFDFHWMEVGASSDECDIEYAGPSGLSELESKALASFVLRNNQTIKLYISLHSWGRWLIYPWCYSKNMSDDWQTLDALARAVFSAIRAVNNTDYTIGSCHNALYPAAGVSEDWVKGVGGVNFSYTIELPGGGKHGFDLPADRIGAVVYETFQGVKVFQSYIEHNLTRYIINKYTKE